MPLVLGLTRPLWHLEMEAPQYRNGLSLDVYAWRDATRLRADPFEAVELDLALLWADVEREPGR